MPHQPDFETFCRLAAQAPLLPVYRQLTGDTLTPVSAFCKIQRGSSAFLFESVVGGERIGRYSFLGAEPFLRFEAYGNEVLLDGPAAMAGKRRDAAATLTRTVDDPLAELQALLADYRAVHVPGLPRFCGGAVGYAGYDVVRYTERLPNPPPDDRRLPDLSVALYDRMVIFDHITKTVLVVAQARCTPSPLSPESPSPLGGEGWGGGADHPTARTAGQAGSATLRAAYDDACARVDDLVRQLQQGVADLQLTDINLAGEPARRCRSNFTREAFEAAVARAKEYILAGDIFQVVLSQRLETETRARPFDIYRALRVVNPSPFMFFLRTPSAVLVGSSPEILVRVEDGKITLRPLAGTRRRGSSEEEDRRLAEELLADPKERAEHVMLVDLGRNDVGRVARYGTVELSDVMTVERYSHVMHITSNVTGELAPGKTAFDALRAALPAGTVSGAPKVRAMQIIDELEPHRRGPYAGAVGYIDFTGNMDTCIALRTLVIQGQTAYLQVGAGIVADSVPATEYEETMNKARGLLKAIEIAEGQL